MYIIQRSTKVIPSLFLCDLVYSDLGRKHDIGAITQAKWHAVNYF